MESGRQLGEKLAQLGRHLELWNRIELLERACKSVPERPYIVSI
jgi:hypothetical protein